MKITEKKVRAGHALVGRKIVGIVEYEKSAGIRLDDGSVLYLDDCELDDVTYESVR